MEIIERTSAPSVEFRQFHISTPDFIELVQKYANPDQKFELIVGDVFSKSRVKFEDVDELPQHQAMIFSPLTLTIGSLELRIGTHLVRLSFDEQDRHVADAMLKDLKSYKSMFSFISSPWINVPLLLGAWFLIDRNFKPDPATSIGILLAGSMVFWLLILPADLKFFGPRVIYQPRDNFFRRNSDKIFLTLLGALIGLGIGTFEKLISYFSANSP